MEGLIENLQRDFTNESRRKGLIPIWIKVLGWFFIVMGAAVSVIYLAAIIWVFPVTFEMFGLHHTGSSRDLMNIVIGTLITINGICAYGLLFGKNWGVVVCLVYGYFTLLITVFSMFVGDAITIRLEPLVQIPYLIMLHRIRPLW